MENVEFTDDEIKEQLASLGYFDVSETRLKQFRKDLQRLVEHDRSSGSSSWFTGITSPSTNSETSPSSQQHHRNKPNLSRYQPHIHVSPRTTEPSTFATSGRSQGTADDSTTSSTNTSPEVRPKVRQQWTTVAESTDPTADIPSTSYDRHDANVDDVTKYFGRLGDNDDLTSSYSHFRTTNDDDVTPETPTTGVSPQPPTSSERRIIQKRKVMRKQENGESAVFDESLVVDGMTGDSYRVHDISMDDVGVQYDRERIPHTLPPRPHTAIPSWKKTSDQDSVHDQPLPSYIRPNTSHPHTRNLRKSDPVHRYHQYRDVWNSIKAPGEKSHHALRWEVKAQMMQKDVPQPKPQRVFVPNTYVVPTSKKRSQLRWEVRHALEYGMPVPSTHTVF